MALKQGFIFKFAQHHEFITSFWNVGENGHSPSTVLGLTFQKSNSQPQNVRHGVFIPFQPLMEWCFDCGWAVPVGNVKQLWIKVTTFCTLALSWKRFWCHSPTQQWIASQLKRKVRFNGVITEHWCFSHWLSNNLVYWIVSVSFFVLYANKDVIVEGKKEGKK